ncbi:hypothetical protein ACFVVM_09210 [Nocardia sp. NPDC058176]|uniref:hypothetical protein n=1 Tax=Nocardia sp. NPDC058176 TaxID=3346368 RepID=UPI0036D9919E
MESRTSAMVGGSALPVLSEHVADGAQAGSPTGVGYLGHRCGSALWPEAISAVNRSGIEVGEDAGLDPVDNVAFGCG